MDGQYAQHITENYINKKPGHYILHIDIQQALSKSKTINKDGKNSYKAFTETSGGVIAVTFIKSTNFVAITTGYIMHSTMEKVTKNKKKKLAVSGKYYLYQKKI